MRSLFLTVIVGVLSISGRAEAQGTPSDEFEVRLLPDLVLTGGMVAAAVVLERARERLAGDLSCPDEPNGVATCNPRKVNPFDRWATGMGLETAASVSDVLLVASLSLPLAFAGVDMAADRQSPAVERLAKDTLVVAQTYAATYFVTNVVKVLVHRLRPFNYDPNQAERRIDGDSRLSFPSGHTAMAFAGAAAFSVLLDQRYPGEAWAVGTAVGGFALASVVGVSRVLAGRHFPTDVLFGAAIGASLGLLVPSLHRGDGEATGAGAVAPQWVLGIGGQF